MKSFLMGSVFVREGLFRRETVGRLLEEHRRNRVDHHVRLWMLLNLEAWYQLYIEGRSVEDVREGIQRTCGAMGQS